MAPVSGADTALEEIATMRGRILEMRNVSRRDEQAWADLAARAVEPNPLAEPGCVIPAALHQSFGAEIGLVVAERDGEFAACVPVRQLRRWYDIPYPIVANKIRRSTYLGTPLVDPDGGVDALATIFRTLRARRRPWAGRLLGLDSLRADARVAGYLSAAADELGLATYVHEDFERALLKRRAEPTYTQGYSKKLRENIRRGRRQLSELLGDEPVLVDRAEDPTAIDEFIALEAAGYKADTVALAAVSGESAFFRDMCARFRAEGRLGVLCLQCAGTTLAMEVWLRGGSGLNLVKISYAEPYGRYGPGTLLHVGSFSHIHDHTDAEWLDTCSSPDNAYLLNLYPDRIRITTVLYSLGGPVDNALVRNLPRVRAAHRRARARSQRSPDADPATASP